MQKKAPSHPAKSVSVGNLPRRAGPLFGRTLQPMKSPRLLPALLFFVLAALPALHAADGRVKLGLQTWTCNRMTFEQVVDFAGRHGITQLQFISGQFDPAAGREETL